MMCEELPFAVYCNQCGVETGGRSSSPVGYMMCSECQKTSMAAWWERMKGDPNIFFAIGDRVSVNYYGSTKIGTVKAKIETKEGDPKRYLVSIDGGNPNLIAKADDCVETYHGDMSPLTEEPRHQRQTISEFLRKMVRRYQGDGVAT